MTPMENFVKFTQNTYSGQELLKKHSLDEEGIWEIRGEDPNCDLGGSHYQPELGIVEGKLRDVIMYGVSLPNFWQWGGGGSFNHVGKKIPKINDQSWIERQELEAEAERLEKELKAVKERLKVHR